MVILLLSVQVFNLRSGRHCLQCSCVTPQILYARPSNINSSSKLSRLSTSNWEVERKKSNEVGKKSDAVSEQGVVVFFPSFSYAEEVHAAWRASGLLQQLAARKRVFTEPREAGQVEGVLREYGECIAAGGEGTSTARGAMLLCVVGGKMAEGINFGDGLGRWDPDAHMHLWPIRESLSCAVA